LIALPKFMTLLGTFFIPITLACFLWKPRHLLPLLVVASVFEAGSVFNGAVGGFVFGVSPFCLMEIAIAFRLFLHVWNGGTLLPPPRTAARGIAVILLAFLVWSFVSALVMPRVFAGMPVISPRERVDVDLVFGNLWPLRWSLSNLGQGIYLVLNTGAVLFAFLVTQSVEQTGELAKALLWAVYIAVGVGLLQYIAPFIGIPYPYSVFNNNPNNLLGFEPLDQQIDGFTRISSTFAEPMNSGSFLAAAACGLLASYLRGERGMLALTGLLATVLVLLQTTSTTGYASLVIMLVPLLIYFNPLARRQLPGWPSFFKGWTTVTATALAGAGLVIVLIPRLSPALVQVTVDKAEGMSFLSRVAADQQSWALLEATHGLGVGLGSNRPSSLIMSLLSTVGIVGTALFAMAIYRIVRLFPGRAAPAKLQMSFWSLMGLLVASMGVPDLNRPALWALLIVAGAQLTLVRTPSSTPPAVSSTLL
jgi:hypothetical protein